MASIDEMFNYLEPENSALNFEEQEWIIVLKDFYARRGFLTEKQTSVVRDIYFRHSGELEEETERFNEEMSEVERRILSGEIVMGPEYDDFLRNLGIYFVDSDDGKEMNVAPESCPSLEAILRLLIEKGIFSGEEFGKKLSQVQQEFKNCSTFC